MLVDVYCERGATGEVYQEYGCKLSCVAGGSDKYYVLQIIQDVDKAGVPTWYLYRRYGSNKQVRFRTQCDAYTNVDEAVAIFKKLFTDKTHNEWESVANSTFKPYPMLYCLNGQ